MRRREFIALVSGAVAWPLSVSAQAQQPSQSHRIALVASVLPSDMTEEGERPLFRAFFSELRRLGYVEGHNIVVERYSTWGLKEPYSELAISVVRQKPDLIVAFSSRIVLALKMATTSIPIVGVMADPVAYGIVKSLSRPGGNITGVSPEAGVEVLGKIGEAGHAWHQHPDRSETRKVFQTGKPVEVGSEANNVLPFDPGDRVRELRAGFVEAVVGSEIVSQLEIVQDAEVRLARRSIKIVVPAGILPENRVDQVMRDERVQSRD